MAEKLKIDDFSNECRVIVVGKITNEIVIVAVRISNQGKASYRTMYSITEGQLNDYIKKGKAWRIKKSD